MNMEGQIYFSVTQIIDIFTFILKRYPYSFSFDFHCIVQLTIRQFGPVIETTWPLKQFFYFHRIWESCIGKYYDILRGPMPKV